MGSDNQEEKSLSANEHGEARMMKAVVKGVLIGLPVALVGMTLALWFFTDRDLAAAAATSILPAVLTGVFFGGFAGMARTMD